MSHAATDEGRSHAAPEVFRTAAGKVSAVVGDVCSLEEALDYTVKLCAGKEACQLLMAGCGEPLSAGAEALCGLTRRKTIAAPGLEPELFEALAGRCRAEGFEPVRHSLRRYLAGIDVALTVADYGIAETGTLVLDSSSEDLRLATMLSEVHVAVLPLSRLRPTALDLAGDLRARMAAPPNYLSFITGASRTADIERVLALGVHGPLAVHILLWEDRPCKSPRI